MHFLASPTVDRPFRIATSSGEQRKDDAEKQGTFACSASRKISITSLSEAAIGLSMKIGFLAMIAALACSRWGRPSMLVSRTASTPWTRSFTYLRKLCWELPNEIPGLRAFSTAMRDTVQEITGEIENEMGDLHRKMAADVQEKLGVPLSALRYTPLPALTDESHAHTIDVEVNSAPPPPDASGTTE